MAGVKDIEELFVLPPFGISRLGSARLDNGNTGPVPDCMDNYRLLDNGSGERRVLVSAPTFNVVFRGKNREAEISSCEVPAAVRFRNDAGLIRPVAPFFELWAKLKGDENPVPLIPTMVKNSKVEWRVHVANRKAQRRTRAEGDSDVVTANSGYFSHHQLIQLNGTAGNFITGLSIPLGHAVAPKPNEAFPEYRLRFMPPTGAVYGHQVIPEIISPRRVVYDTTKPTANWHRYNDPDFADPYPTNPGGLERAGYFDDTSDGFIEVRVGKLSAFARITCGPPDYMPDSFHVRSAMDEFEQLLHGPDIAAGETTLEKVRKILSIFRSLVETVRMMNPAALNQHRFIGEVFDASRVGYKQVLAIHNRAHSWIRGLATDDPDKFARAVQEVERIGDRLREPETSLDGTLINQNAGSPKQAAAARRMPALMRGSDAGELALTRRQISYVRSIGDSAFDSGLRNIPNGDRLAALPVNRTAQLHYEANGNPPAAHLDTTISNCFPGLEFDLRNVWAGIFKHLRLHETENYVTQVTKDAPGDLAKLAGCYLEQIMWDGGEVEFRRSRRPLQSSTLERSNAFANLIKFASENPDKGVTCRFFARPSVFLASSQQAALFDEFGSKFPSTAWSSEESDENCEEQVTLTFGDVRELPCLRIFAGFSDIEPEFRLFPREFEIFFSVDGEKWGVGGQEKPNLTINDKNFEKYFSADRWCTIDIKNVRAKYVRLVIRSKRKNGKGKFVVSIPEIQFYPEIVETLELNTVFAKESATLNMDIAQPGELTQSLCAPWMYDYRDCWCVYWAASRPDMVNIDEDGHGHNWMDVERPRDSEGRPQYRTGRTNEIDYETAISNWESKDVFKFQIGGKDEK